MTTREAEIIELLHKEVKPALGCTEPIAVALAVAKAVEVVASGCTGCNAECALWRQTVDFVINVAVSGNILKNGMGVGIPGTGMVGLHIAAALGAVCGKSRYGLEVLHDLSDGAVERAKALVAKGKVRISIADTTHKLYVKAGVEIEGGHAASAVVRTHDILAAHSASATIEDDHDNIVETSFDDKIVEVGGKELGKHSDKDTLDYGLSVREIYDFAISAAYKDISFILEDRTLNMALAEEGLRGEYGLRVGKSIRDAKFDVYSKNDFLSCAMSYTAAASDARMAGCTLPAMSNSGSGNQGITVSMPVIAYAKKYDVDDEALARALILSNLVAIHIKGYLGKLSALCGCVIASTGSACGLVLLKGGDYECVCSAIKNMVGNITGMVCDGAKVGCALKVASGVSSAVQSAMLALSGISAGRNDGIIDDDIEKTIRNLGKIGSVGMQATDAMILDIMVSK